MLVGRRKDASIPSIGPPSCYLHSKLVLAPSSSACCFAWKRAGCIDLALFFPSSEYSNLVSRMFRRPETICFASLPVVRQRLCVSSSLFLLPRMPLNVDRELQSYVLPANLLRFGSSITVTEAGQHGQLATPRCGN